MTNSEIETLVKKALFDVAPDLEGESVEPNATFRDQFEIDSMDFLNFIIALSKETGRNIPEAVIGRSMVDRPSPAPDHVSYMGHYGRFLHAEIGRQ